MDDNTTLWIVGRVRDPISRPHEWEFMGVFDSLDKARAACTERYDFIGPTQLNKRMPDELTEWQNATYPLYEAEA